MKPIFSLAKLCLVLILAILLLQVVFSPSAADPVPESTTIPTTVPTTVPVPTCPLPLDDWRMQLVNGEHLIPEDYPAPALTAINERFSVDSRCYEDLMAMLTACEADGLSPLVRSAYRSMADQVWLFDRKMDRLLAEGLSQEEAYRQAQIEVALPGTSEHHTGLAVDLVDFSYQELDEQQEQTAVQQWLLEHCWDYGFILRYPNDKTEITGIIYEPWHYRYVGREVAAEIRDSGLCFEEYLAQFGS